MQRKEYMYNFVHVYCNLMVNNYTTDDVFGPLEFSRRPLMAINIQRARDHGVPDYNTVRRSYGLESIENLPQINPELSSQNPQVRLSLSTISLSPYVS